MPVIRYSDGPSIRYSAGPSIRYNGPKFLDFLRKGSRYKVQWVKIAASKTGSPIASSEPSCLEEKRGLSIASSEVRV